MAYNKAKTEKQWLKWKEGEEKKLRELGVDEETIQRLHTYDWAQFNKERQYLQRRVEWSLYIDWISSQDLILPVENSKDFLNSIENMDLLQVLLLEDELTINIIFFKVKGYSTEQICQQLGITKYAFYNRVKRLKKKLKNILKGD